MVLPIIIESNQNGEKEVKLYSSEELMNEGYLYASRWFHNVENIWGIHRTEKNEKITAEDYLNWQNKLTNQNLNAPYLVLYNTSGKDANSVVLKEMRWN